jgi:hypothetical protein
MHIDTMARFEHSTEPPLIEDDRYIVRPHKWKIIPSSAISGTLPPGEYYIGDLKNIMYSSIYYNIYGDTMGFNDGIYSCDNDIFAISRSSGAIGNASNGFKYNIDTGVFGIMRTTMIDPVKEYYSTPGTIYYFQYPIDILFNTKGYKFATKGFELWIPRN